MSQLRFIFPIVLLISLIPIQMPAQQKARLGQPILHGHYKPHGHFGRAYTFYNDGRFESVEKGNDLKKGKIGKGKFERDGKRLSLTFETMPIPGELGMTVEGPHTEKFKVHFEEDNSQEVTRFRLNLKGPKKEDPRWQRSDEFIPYKLPKKSSTQE